jgi:hypothetical protein
MSRTILFLLGVVVGLTRAAAAKNDTAEPLPAASSVSSLRVRQANTGKEASLFIRARVHHHVLKTKPVTKVRHFVFTIARKKALPKNLKFS